MSPLFRASIVSLSSVLAAACSASYPTAPSTAAPVALQVQYGSTMSRARPGSTYAFHAYSLDQDGAYELVTSKAAWVSSDAAVMQPSSTAGRFLAVAPGPARITARYEGLESSLSTVVVDPQLQAFPLLTLSNANPVRIGGTSRPTVLLQQSLNGPRADVTNRVTWTSADPGVVTIDQNGILTAIGHGTTLITASLDGLIDWYWLSIAPSS